MFEDSLISSKRDISNVDRFQHAHEQNLKYKKLTS